MGRSVVGGNESSYEQSYDGREGVLPERIEVRARPERRRRWTAAAKLAIVRETLAPGATAQVMADRHGIDTGLLYTWRKQMLRVAMAVLAMVEIKPEAPAEPAAAVKHRSHHFGWRRPADARWSASSSRWRSTL